jgi:hypothetical protein
VDVERLKVSGQELDKMLVEAQRLAKEVDEHLRARRLGRHEQRAERRRKPR